MEELAKLKNRMALVLRNYKSREEILIARVKELESNLGLKSSI